MQRLFKALDALGVTPYVRFAPQIVRGLAYYTGTVFEAWDVEGEFRAMFGGGRYDNLVAAVGGDPLPATGFAMGDVVISLILKKFGLIPASLEASPAPVLVTIFEESMLPASIALAAELRQAGINVNCYPEAAKLSKQFKFADRIGVKIVLVLGPDELTARQVTIKDLVAGTQTTTDREKAVEVIRSILAR
jgi:histidyl-tRNA synthetase